MKVKTIGTGALTVSDRSACLLIDDKILVDCGNGILKTLLSQGVDLNKINTLLITHLHGDHFLDIPFLIMQRKFDDVKNNLNIYCPLGTEKVIADLVKLAYSDTEDWTKYRDATKVKFIEFKKLDNEEVTKDYFVDSYELIHGDIPAYGFVIKAKDKAIGLSGDSAYCDNIDKIIEASDLSVMDMSFIDSTKKHMGVHDMEMLTQKYNKSIIAIHMSQPAKDYALSKGIDNLIVPNDGDEFEV